jgi:N-acyl-D-aspartate/D-glutamate deacylase
MRGVRRTGAVVGAIAAWTFSAGCTGVEEYDVLLQGGTVVDGTGAPGVVADVAIRGDRIVAVGADLPSGGAGRVVDVAGLVVAPGFWDNHAHLVTLEEHPDAENFIRQGITTILAPLHSQDQVFPMDAYMARVRTAPNVGLFAGHTWIRTRVMGLENRPPTDAELAWMVALVDSSMQQGALGLSTGLEYIPAVFADTDEVVALAEVAAPYGGIYVTHMRDEGVRVLESIGETLEVGRRAGIPVQVNHHKVTGAANWGLTEQTLAMLDSASAAGQEVVHDVYPYTAFSTYSDILFPGWALADGADAFRSRVDDSATRRRMVSEMRTIFLQQTGSGPESIQFRNVDSHPEMQGRTLADYLTDRGRPTTVNEAVEAMIELQLEGGFIGIFEGMAEEDVIRIMRHPTAMFETDGDLVQPGVGFPHPRSYGSFPRVLAKYVRDEGVLTLEEAVRKMTSQPAAWIGQSERGVLREGAIADVVVFDVGTIQDEAAYTDPHHYSTGVMHVFVGGVAVLENGEMTGQRPGRFLERGRPR